jgi:hypothetical protein
MFMAHQKHPSEAPRKQENPQPTPNQTVGGREFGQVIEPMQAQMASGNEGLTDKAETPHREKPTRKESGKKRHKAA